jgi:hypothetical protein
LLIVFCSLQGRSQSSDSAGINVNDTAIISQFSTDSLDDSTITSILDSTQTDSTASDSLKPKRRRSSLDHQVLYNAEDSMLIDLGEDKVYLYGKAVAEYGDIKLEADFIEISLSKSELRATGLPDSNGKIVGTPVFQQGNTKFESGEMRYNFKTQRGLSKTVRTQEGEGYIHGEVVKKDTGKVIYIQNGKYTTCEYEDPHFHIHAKKLKIITEDKIITGPAYLSIADVPTPLAIPFGFFPNSEGRANGIIIPSWGETRGLGLSLNGGGYYFGIGDVADVAITADVFTRGSWNGYINSRYAKKYKYSGSGGLQLVKRIYGEPEFPGYNNKPLRYKIKWTHRQDPKARPGRTFSASVDFGNPDADRLNTNESATNQLRNSTKSSVNYTKNFANSPFALRVAASSDQNAKTGNVNLQLPNAALTMARVYPFKRDAAIGKEAPWEKIGIRGSLEAKNQVTAPFERLFSDSTLGEMRNGMRADIPINAGYKVLRFFTLTPSISNKLTGLRQTVRQEWNPDSNRVDEYKVNELAGYWEGGANLSLSTVIYGIYNYRSDVIKAMRHQVTPSASIGYKPDYSDPFWGYYKSVQTDSFGNMDEYSIYQTGVYNAPASKENGVLNLALNNTFELKVRNREDSTGDGKDKKLKLLDALGFATSYNLAKDSNNWAPLRISVRTSIVPGLRFNGSATLDPYAWNNETGRKVAEFWYTRNGKIGKWTRAQGNFTYNINPKSTRKKSEKKKDKLENQGLYYDDFVDFEVPWNASVTYNINYSRTAFTETISQNVDLRGDINLTTNWKVGVQTSYDIREQEISYTSFNVYRNLHCWEMSLRVVPFGTYQSYNFAINVKASTLQDLKLNRNRQFNVPLR